MVFKKTYSLKKVHNHYFTHFKWYQKHKDKLTSLDREEIERNFLAMERALASKDKEGANRALADIETFVGKRKVRNWWEYPVELIGAIGFALIVATIIRQMVFEPYEIPSGSMRPTFEEKDHLVVSKTTFGINIPLTTGHFLFDESLVKRGGVFIFSGEGIDLPDTTDRYFWIFPASKRYIKRNMGKPGDSIYFYGGMLYSIDKEGNPINEFLEPPYRSPLIHVPFITFEGRMVRGPSAKPGFAADTTYKHFNRPVGRLSLAQNGAMLGEIYNGKRWVRDNPLANKTPHDTLETYSDYYGIGNFAMARLLTQNELKVKPDEEAPLYLQLAHTPYLPTQLSSLEPRPVPDFLSYQQSLIPLDQESIDRLMNNLYTARFIVERGRVKRYGQEGFSAEGEVVFPNVPDGTYEFYYGKGYSVGFGAILSPLPEDHPLYSRDPANVQRLFNYGIDPSNLYDPMNRFGGLFPNRYAFWRGGDFYLMDGPLFSKGDEALNRFIERENERGEKEATYYPFLDKGPPLKEDGTFDVAKIRTFGFTLPENGYLALGDNHAMSGDSRTFGAVPEANLEGTPLVILWPPQGRFGLPKQATYSHFAAPTIIVLGLTGLILFLFTRWNRNRRKLPLYIKQTQDL